LFEYEDRDQTQNDVEHFAGTEEQKNIRFRYISFLLLTAFGTGDPADPIVLDVSVAQIADVFMTFFAINLHISIIDLP
jgi:hypothetical protein